MTDELAAVIDIAELLPLGVEVGAGIHGVTYRVLSDPTVVLKRYRAGVEPDPERLDALVTWLRSLPPVEREIVQSRSAWPLARVTHGDQTTGVLLPAAPSPPTLAPDSTGSRSVRSLRSLAELLAAFSRHEISHGELSPDSVLLYQTDPGAFVLDCDTAVVGQQAAAMPRSTQPAWTDPRLAAGSVSTADAATDELMLARLFCRHYLAVDHVGGALSDRIPGHPPITHDIRVCIQEADQPTGEQARFNAWSAALAELDRQLTSPASPLRQATADAPTVLADSESSEAHEAVLLGQMPPPTAKLDRSPPPTAGIDHLPPPATEIVDRLPAPTAKLDKLPPPASTQGPPSGLVTAFTEAGISDSDHTAKASHSDPPPDVQPSLGRAVAAILVFSLLIAGFAIGFFAIGAV